MLWPNHFVTRPNMSFVRYDELSVEEFVLGMARIMKLPELTATELKARLSHLESMMTYARNYQWAPLRSMYATAMDGIQYGDLD